MKVKMNTGLLRFFAGTYCTGWEPDDDEQGFEFEYDGTEALRSIALAYHKNEKYILSEIQDVAPGILANVENADPFVTGIHFTGTVWRPKEYNFKTDELDFVLTIDKARLLHTLNVLRDNEEFAQFLEDRYTSRDGFWSHTPNSYEGIREVIVHHTKGARYSFEQGLAAILNFLCRDKWAEIDEHVREYWSSSDYCGLNYTVREPATLS